MTTKTATCECGAARDPRAALCRACRDASHHGETKTCTGPCGRELPSDSFTWRPNGRGGRKRRSRCRACDSAASSAYRQTPEGRKKSNAAKRKWEQANPDAHRRLQLRAAARKLGLDPDVVEERAKAITTCEICGRAPEAAGTRARRLSLDHDHQTGAFRGLLCGPCNSLIGLAGEEPDRLLAAVEYLRRHLSAR